MGNRTIAQDATPVWNFSNWVPQAVVINLGTNDYSSPAIYPPFDVFSAAYKQFIGSIQSKYGQSVTIFLVCGPMTTKPCNTISEVAKSYSSGVYYIDLQNILNSTEFGCDGHPNVAGHQKMATLSLPVIQNILHWN